MERKSLLFQKIFRRIEFIIWKSIFVCFYRSSFSKMGENVYIGHPLKLEGPGGISVGSEAIILPLAWLACLPLLEGVNPSLEIGAGTYIGRSAHIIAIKHVRIGDKVLIADRVYISDNVHGYEDPTRPIIEQQVVLKGDVEIGDGSWLGENTCVIGAKIGVHCVIGANSVVTRDIPDYSVAVGAPARIIKRWDAQSGAWVKVGAK